MTAFITAATTVSALVDHWLAQLRTQGRLENTTINEYERVLRKLVVPVLGNSRLDELTTDRLNLVLADLGMQSVNRQRKAKVVTGAMLDMAVEAGAMPSNPVRGSLSISRPKSAARALTPEELNKLRIAVHTWMTAERPGPKSSGDLADIIDLMLATGARIGEVLALRWSDIDLDARAAIISGTVKTETGKGTFRRSLSATRTVALPEFAIIVLARRVAARMTSEIGAVFPTRNGTWQQVNNVERRWRQVRANAGLEGVTPNAFQQSALDR